MTRSTTPQKEQVGKFRKKPVEVEAIQWTGDRVAMVVWLKRVLPDGTNLDKLIQVHSHGKLRIFTPGGYWICKEGEWLVLEPYPELRDHLPSCCQVRIRRERRREGEGAQARHQRCATELYAEHSLSVDEVQDVLDAAQSDVELEEQVHTDAG